MNCPKCKAKIPDHVKYCPECGEKITPIGQSIFNQDGVIKEVHQTQYTDARKAEGANVGGNININVSVSPPKSPESQKLNEIRKNKRFPWWAVAVGCVVVIGIVIAVIVLNSNRTPQVPVQAYTPNQNQSQAPISVTNPVSQNPVTQYNLNVTVMPVGSGAINPGAGKYNNGSTVTLTATPTSGYKFSSWSGDVSGTNPNINITLDSSKNIVANFSPISYTLQVMVDPPGSGAIGPTATNYQFGKSVTLTAVANFPYDFANWSGTDNDNINPTTVTMISNKTIIANFKQLDKAVEKSVSNRFSNPPVTIAKLQLSKGSWIQGEIKGSPDISVHITDVNNSVLKEFGRISGCQFTFQAPTDGLYFLVIYKVYSLGFTDYSIMYAIYSQVLPN